MHFGTSSKDTTAYLGNFSIRMNSNEFLELSLQHKGSLRIESN